MTKKICLETLKSALGRSILHYCFRAPGENVDIAKFFWWRQLLFASDVSLQMTIYFLTTYSF